MTTILKSKDQAWCRGLVQLRHGTDYTYNVCICISISTTRYVTTFNLIEFISIL